jgi:hypothetical protein
MWFRYPKARSGLHFQVPEDDRLSSVNSCFLVLTQVQRYLMHSVFYRITWLRLHCSMAFTPRTCCVTCGPQAYHYFLVPWNSQSSIQSMEIPFVFKHELGWCFTFSQINYNIFCNNAVVSWKTKHSAIIGTSSTEAELINVAYCAASSLSSKVGSRTWQVSPTIFFEDYNGAIALGNSGHLRGVPNTLICKESHSSF